MIDDAAMTFKLETKGTRADGRTLKIDATFEGRETTVSLPPGRAEGDVGISGTCSRVTSPRPGKHEFIVPDYKSIRYAGQLERVTDARDGR